MPFEIIRGDITEIKADSIVNTANPNPVIGSIAVGQAAVTRAYDLDAKFVIHAVGPVWEGGGRDEEALLRQCYDNALALAAKKRCKSVAFPLLSAGNYGFPKAVALQIAINAFSAFLMDHEMRIILVVLDRDAFALSEKLFRLVRSYIDEHYIEAKLREEYTTSNHPDYAVRPMPPPMAAPKAAFTMPMASAPAAAPARLKDMLQKTDAGFSETLLKLIDRTGKKDA